MMPFPAAHNLYQSVRGLMAQTQELVDQIPDDLAAYGRELDDAVGALNVAGFCLIDLMTKARPLGLPELVIIASAIREHEASHLWESDSPTPRPGDGDLLKTLVDLIAEVGRVPA